MLGICGEIRDPRSCVESLKKTGLFLKVFLMLTYNQLDKCVFPAGLLYGKSAGQPNPGHWLRLKKLEAQSWQLLRVQPDSQMLESSQILN